MRIDINDFPISRGQCIKDKLLGLKPRSIVEQTRIGEIRMAMNRYIDDFKVIPLDWIFEYNDLASRQKKGRS
jgi:hypothetical protein